MRVYFFNDRTDKILKKKKKKRTDRINKNIKDIIFQMVQEKKINE